MNDLDDTQPTTAEHLADTLPAAPPPRRRRGRPPKKAALAAETETAPSGPVSVSDVAQGAPATDTAPASTSVLAPAEVIDRPAAAAPRVQPDLPAFVTEPSPLPAPEASTSAKGALQWSAGAPGRVAAAPVFGAKAGTFTSAAMALA